MLHTFLRYCSYTEHRRRSLRLQADRSSMDQGHNIAMERKACPLISDIMVYCKGIEHYPYFTDQFTYLLFYSLLLPRSHPFFLFSYKCTISPRIYVYRYIYMYLHTHIHISIQKLIKTINILLFTASCFTNTISSPKDLFANLCILCLFCSGIFFFLLFWG